VRLRFIWWAVGASLLGLVALGIVALVETSQSKHGGVVVKVDFKTRPQATRAQENAVVQLLSSNPYVKEIQYVPKEAALLRLKKRYPMLLSGLPWNPLPDSIMVTPTEGKYAPELVAGLRSLPGVEAAWHSALLDPAD
jgi:cell division protein FtsX